MGGKQQKKQQSGKEQTTDRSVRTRAQLVKAAFGLFHRQGYHATGLSQIISESGLSKGALYNHFSSKAELGYAVVDDVLAPLILSFWVSRYKDSSDFISTTQSAIADLVKDPPEFFWTLGCPMNNLIQEMSAVDERFRKRLSKVANAWVDSLAKHMKAGQDRKIVRDDVDSRAAAAFIVSALEGALSLAKVNQNPSVLAEVGSQLKRYLESLRPSARDPK